MIAVIGGVQTTVRVKLAIPERDMEKQKKQDEDAVLAAGLDVEAAGGEESPEDARFRHYYEQKMREQAGENYWDSMGLGVKDFGGYPPVAPGENTDIRVTSSGCSYNVAKYLGEKIDTAFISVMGDDTLGTAAKAELAARGVDISGVKTLHASTAVGVEVANPMGDLEFARENMALLTELTPEYVESCGEILAKADAIFMDGTLPEETMKYISDNYSDKCPIYFDPASIHGGSVFARSGAKAACIMPGRMEAEAISGLQVLGMDQLMAAGNAFESMGIPQTVITLKMGGLYYKDAAEAGIIKPENPLSFGDTKGAGDVLSAELVYHLVSGAGLREAAEGAVAAAGEYIAELNR